MNNNIKVIDLSFLTLAQKYLHTAKSILEQMVENGNPWMPNLEIENEDELWNEYFKVTKWSDFEIIIPTLFLFFHGLELLNKGLLFLADENMKLNHNIKELFDAVEKKYSSNSELINTLRKYCDLSSATPSIIRNFTTNNTEITDIQSLYQSLRYPSGKQLQTAYKYITMKYKEKEAIPFAQELIDDINTLLTQAVKIYRAKKS